MVAQSPSAAAAASATSAQSAAAAAAASAIVRSPAERPAAPSDSGVGVGTAVVGAAVGKWSFLGVRAPAGRGRLGPGGEEVGLPPGHELRLHGTVAPHVDRDGPRPQQEVAGVDDVGVRGGPAVDHAKSGDAVRARWRTRAPGRLLHCPAKRDGGDGLCGNQISGAHAIDAICLRITELTG